MTGSDPMLATARRQTSATPAPAGSTALTPTAKAPSLRPLITASEMFPALEELVLSAQSEVLLAFRIFDARTRLHSDAARDLGLATWADLFAHAAARGVALRLLLADFDPVFTADLHRAAWSSAGRFAARTADHPNAEIICALHDCAPAPIWETVFGPQIRKRLSQIKTHAPEHLTPAQQRAIQGDHRLRPVTLHQKFAVIDGSRTIIGGIDVDERRWDDHDHNQRPEDTWHDVSMAVDGAFAQDLRRHFAACWDRARTACGTTFSAAATALPPQPAAPQDAASPDLLRTVSTHLKHPLRFGPVTEVRENETATLEAIAQANRSIYIETQFLRHMPIARALADRARACPDLNLILVLPTEPERVIFGRSSGADARHAQALQLRCLRLLQRAFGPRLAVVSPAQPRPAPDGTPLPVAGSGIIYLHSKVTLIDDQIGIVGSANLNGRSLLWDTEASVRFRDPTAITELRTRLGRKWLGDTAEPLDQATTWAMAARNAAQTPPEDRTTMVLPYPEGRNRRFARYLPILPAAMF